MTTEIIPYQTKIYKLHRNHYGDVYASAQIFYKPIEKRIKRRPYIRSAYFEKDKIFFDFFWKHIWQKSPSQRADRLRYFPCAIDLIQNSRQKPISKLNPNKKTETLHRFVGLSKEKELFFVQIKENNKTGRKYLMSVFPPG